MKKCFVQTSAIFLFLDWYHCFYTFFHLKYLKFCVVEFVFIFGVVKASIIMERQSTETRVLVIKIYYKYSEYFAETYRKLCTLLGFHNPPNFTVICRIIGPFEESGTVEAGRRSGHTRLSNIPYFQRYDRSSEEKDFRQNNLVARGSMLATTVL